MPHTRSSVAFTLTLTVALAGVAVGCSRPESVENTAPAAPAAAPVVTPAKTEEPKYEPAYPAEVSSDGLTEKDAEQQAVPHRHDGGEEHAHGEGTDGHAH